MPRLTLAVAAFGTAFLSFQFAASVNDSLWAQEPESPAPPTAPATPTETQKPADQKGAWELYRLGKVHAQGMGVPKDAVKARGYFELALQATDRKVARAAAFALGQLALHDLADPQLAAASFAKGVELGDAWSIYSLAKLHRPGTGALPDPLEARRYYEMALASGDAAVAKAAAFDLGQLALKDLKDPSLAVRAFQKGAELQDGWASYRLAEIHASGAAGPKDLQEARRYFEQAMAGADRDVAKAASFALGQMALRQLKDSKLARSALQRGVDLGDPWSMFLLAQSLENQKDNRRLARTLYADAIAASKDVELSKAALFALAELYLVSPGRNRPQALRLHAQASKLGNDWSTYSLGNLHAQGLGVPKNPRTARDHFVRAMRSRDPEVVKASAFALGQLYLQKPLLNPKRAAEYFAAGSRLGDVWSKFNLAQLHATGGGVKRSASQAKKLYENVAAGRDPAAATAASFALGRMHMRGPLRNMRLAERYFKFGAARQDGWSAYYLAEIYLAKRGNSKRARALITQMSRSVDPQVRLAAASLRKRLKR
jgi:TPR repeat protein